MSEHHKNWLVLAQARLPGHQASELIKQFGSVEGVRQADSAAIRAAGVCESVAQRIAQPDMAAIDKALAWLDVPDHHLVPIASGSYSPLLLLIPDAPILLYINGNPDALHLPGLAIVGSRNPTRGGQQNAHQFAAYLGQSGYCIHSGLAQGIDTAAHEGALAGGAQTVAFLGHGIDRIYPSENRQLARRIASQGALVSEYPLGSAPRPEHFPQRNRLISGCTMGCLVVEAARRSGSLITARLASEQGREVFAIPGSIHNALARGCHSLIRQGAKLVESAEDITSELGPIAGHLMQSTGFDEKIPDTGVDRDNDYKLLIKTLGYDPATADEVADKSGLTIEQVSSMLLILELEGEIEALHGGRYSLLGSNPAVTGRFTTR